MTIYLKQSTASQEVALGFFVDSTDGNTEETGLTIANTDIRLHKAGATTLANPSAGATHISNGIYYWVADATDSGTLGPLVVNCHPTGALAVRVECCVLAANVYDSLIGGGDLLDVNTAQWLGTAVSTPTVAGVPNVNVKTWNDLTTVALPLVPTTAGRTLDVSATGEAGLDWANVGSPTTAVNLSATNIDVDQVVASVSGAVGSVTGLTAANLDVAVSTLATAANLATVASYIDTEVAAIKAVTDVIPNAGALTTIQADLDNIQTRIPTALVGGRMDADLGAIGSSTTALTAFKSAVQGNVIGTIGSGSTTTSLVTSSVTPATSVTDQLKGRIVTFKDDTTTAALRGQSTDITGSTASATPTLTVTALTTAAVSGDTFTVT